MKKKPLIITIISVLIVTLVLGVYYYYTRQDKETSLTILEKRWIERNKNDLIDISIMSDAPVFSYNGEGLIFDFIKSTEEKTGLNFNKLSYQLADDPSSEYAFATVNKPGDNDVIMYEDNYVLLTTKNVKYNSLAEIDSMVVGTLANELNNVNYYLGKNKSLTFKTYTESSDLFGAINNGSVDAIVVPKTIYLENIISNSKINISYNITDMKKYFVLRLGSNKDLNKILSKYYEKWSKDNFENSFNHNLSECYFSFKQIYEQDKAAFRSKQYKYAFVDNAPYDSIVNGELKGINNELIKSFANVADIEISYKKYKNYEDLLKDFNSNNIDFYFNTSSISKYSMDVSNTVSAYNARAAVLVHNKNNAVITSEYSLNKYDVVTIKNSKIDKYLDSIKVNTINYNNIKEIAKKKKKNNIIVIDNDTYNTYRNTKFKDFINVYQFDINSDYYFTGRDINNNKIFNSFFSFYISYMDTNLLSSNINNNIFNIKKNNYLIFIVIFMLLLIGACISVFVLKHKGPEKKKKVVISKEDKLRYVDMLTSLKNRNYLNDSMEKWDNSGIYPQAIVIVDLNNVAYINDNYGHEEGDKVIKEAASILIQTQIENTEIIRTNGNEFLVYMVEYDEKHVVSYIRKVNKELKELSHGFGAAIGYSMIVDELKTIDDAINEATIDMKNNKEEVQESK